MPTPSSPLERANGILRAFSAPFRLRKHRRSRWVTVYEILPDRRTRERSLPGCGAVDPLRWSGFSGQPPSLISEAGHHP